MWLLVFLVGLYLSWLVSIMGLFWWVMMCLCWVLGSSMVMVVVGRLLVLLLVCLVIVIGWGVSRNFLVSGCLCCIMKLMIFILWLLVVCNLVVGLRL